MNALRTEEGHKKCTEFSSPPPLGIAMIHWVKIIASFFELLKI